jgi:MFS family permease
VTSPNFAAHRARRTAILTVLGWNAGPALAVITTVLIALASHDSEGWNVLFAVAAAVIGGAAVLFNTGVGLLIATWSVGRGVNRAAAEPDGRAPTGRGSGTLAALVAWLITLPVLAILYVVQLGIF